MLYRNFSYNVADGNVSSTSVGSVVGDRAIVGTLETSPGSDHDATVELIVNSNFHFPIAVYPARTIAFYIPLFTAASNVSFATNVSGSDGAYGITIGTE